MSSENNHWSMKDREDWTQDDWDQFQKETNNQPRKITMATYCKEVEEAVESVLPAITLEWVEAEAKKAEAHPDWDLNVGRCMQLLFRVMMQQNKHEVIVTDFMYMVEKYAIGVTLHDVPCDLDQAYAVAGYIRHPVKKVELDPLPF